jgi:SHS family lactate transporter-like MFS transporter
MGAEWPAGAALAMEQWPVRSRGLMSGVLQGSWGLGFLLSSAIYGLLYSYIGWRGMLWIGVLPALWSMIIPAALAIPIAPLYLLTTDFTWIAVGFVLQGAFGNALYSQLPSYLAERFPTEVRATAIAFCYHQGAIWGGLVPPVLVYFATTYNLGLAIPMLVSTVIAAASVVISLLLSPETKGKVLVADLALA